MSWTKTSSASATRPVAPRERFMTLVAASELHNGGEQYVIFATVVLSKALTPDDLALLLPQFKSAWLALRFEHPSIASTLSTDSTSFEYTSPTTEQLRNEWLDRTFIFDNTATTTEQLRTRLRDRANSSVTFAPHAKAILLAQPHYKTDGRAILQLCGRYLALCNEPPANPSHFDWGTELGRLVPSLAELAKLDLEPPQDQIARLDQEALDFLKVGAPTGQKLDGDPSSAPKDPLTDHILLSSEETSAIIRACKARDLGLGSAIHAAAALNSLSLADPSFSREEYKYGVHRDLRSRLPAPWNGIASVAGEMVTSTVARIPPNSDFAAATAALEVHRKQGFTDEMFLSDEAMWTRMLQIMASIKPEDMKPTLDLLLSSLGIVDPFFDNTKAISAAQIEMGGQTYSAMSGGWAYTFRGRLNLTMSYNEAYRSRESMRKYLDTVKAILERELL